MDGQYTTRGNAENAYEIRLNTLKVRSGRRREFNIIADRSGMGYEDVDWIQLAQDGVQNSNEPLGPIKAKNFSNDRLLVSQEGICCMRLLVVTDPCREITLSDLKVTQLSYYASCLKWPHAFSCTVTVARAGSSAAIAAVLMCSKPGSTGISSVLVSLAVKKDRLASKGR